MLLVNTYFNAKNIDFVQIPCFIPDMYCGSTDSLTLNSIIDVTK